MSSEESLAAREAIVIEREAELNARELAVKAREEAVTQREKALEDATASAEPDTSTLASEVELAAKASEGPEVSEQSKATVEDPIIAEVQASVPAPDEEISVVQSVDESTSSALADDTIPVEEPAPIEEPASTEQSSSVDKSTADVEHASIDEPTAATINQPTAVDVDTKVDNLIPRIPAINQDTPSVDFETTEDIPVEIVLQTTEANETEDVKGTVPEITEKNEPLIFSESTNASGSFPVDEHVGNTDDTTPDSKIEESGSIETVKQGFNEKAAADEELARNTHSQQLSSEKDKSPRLANNLDEPAVLELVNETPLQEVLRPEQLDEGISLSTTEENKIQPDGAANLADETPLVVGREKTHVEKPNVI